MHFSTSATPSTRYGSSSWLKEYVRIDTNGIAHMWCTCQVELAKSMM